LQYNLNISTLVWKNLIPIKHFMIRNYTKPNLKSKMKRETNIRVVRLILLVIVAAFLKIPGYGEKIADLPEIRYPFSIDIGHNRLFVADIKSMVHIYELQGNSTYFVRTFGQNGQGPGEFQFIHRLRVNGKEIEIPTHGKYATFSLDGKFLKEFRLRIRPFKNGIYKVGKTLSSDI